MVCVPVRPMQSSTDYGDQSTTPTNHPTNNPNQPTNQPINQLPQPTNQPINHPTASQSGRKRTGDGRVDFARAEDHVGEGVDVDGVGRLLRLQTHPRVPRVCHACTVGKKRRERGKGLVNQIKKCWCKKDRIGLPFFPSIDPSRKLPANTCACVCVTGVSALVKQHHCSPPLLSRSLPV